MIPICALTSARFTVCQQRVPVLTQTPSPRGFNDAYLATSKCITIWKGDTHHSMSYIGIKLHFRIICDQVILHISFILDSVDFYVVNVTDEFVCFNKWLLKFLCTIRWLHIIFFLVFWWIWLHQYTVFFPVYYNKNILITDWYNISALIFSSHNLIGTYSFEIRTYFW